MSCPSAISLAKLLFFTILLCCVSVGFAVDPVIRLEEAMDDLSDGRYIQAEQIYREVSLQNPNSDVDLQARKGLSIVYAIQKKDSDVDTLVRNLISDFPAHKNLTQTVCGIGDQYYKQTDFARAAQLFSTAIYDCPKNNYSMWAQCGVISSNIALGQEAVVKAGIKKLVTDYADYPDTPTALGYIIENYLKREQYSKAAALCPALLELYKASLSNAVDKTDELGAYAGIAKAKAWTIEAEADPNLPAITDYSEVDQVVSLMLSDYQDQPRLGLSVFEVGEQFYYQAMKEEAEGNTALAEAKYMKAIAVWDKNIKQVSDPLYQCQAYYYSAEVYRRIGKYEQALVCYQQVIDQYPQYEKAWYARYMMTTCFDKLAEQKVLDDAVAEELKQDIYRELLENDPNCPAARIASRKLSTSVIND